MLHVPSASSLRYRKGSMRKIGKNLACLPWSRLIKDEWGTGTVNNRWVTKSKTRYEMEWNKWFKEATDVLVLEVLVRKCLRVCRGYYHRNLAIASVLVSDHYPFQFWWIMPMDTKYFMSTANIIYHVLSLIETGGWMGGTTFVF